MTASKADIIARLKKDILPLHGFKSSLNNIALDKMIGPIKNAFPGNHFALGVIHEFIADSQETAAVTTGFVAAVLAPLMQNGGTSIWIVAGKNVFPPALKTFGIAPDKIIFIEVKKEKEILWVMEEALKCEGLSAVVADMPNLSFNASRRLQLTVEKSKVTGFVLRLNPRTINTTACVTRWQIKSLRSQLPDGMPGVGFARWKVNLQKVRNGKPGSWDIELIAGRFRQVNTIAAIPLSIQQKTG
jgi:protein ImuA